MEILGKRRGVSPPVKFSEPSFLVPKLPFGNRIPKFYFACQSWGYVLETEFRGGSVTKQEFGNEKRLVTRKDW